MMAAASSSSSAQKMGSRSRFRSHQPMSDINVTPLVDVMLVLLIIFMVTAPLLTVGVPVNLPKTKAGPLNDQKEPITITINAEGEVYLQETKLSIDELIPKVQAILEQDPNNKVYIRGDGESRYMDIVAVMGALNGAGISKIALLTELPKAGSKVDAQGTPKRKGGKVSGNAPGNALGKAAPQPSSGTNPPAGKQTQSSAKGSVANSSGGA